MDRPAGGQRSGRRSRCYRAMRPSGIACARKICLPHHFSSRIPAAASTEGQSSRTLHLFI